MKNKKKAFTLTELLVVVIVIGVLSAAVLPKFNKVIETRKTTEAEELMASIRTEQEKRCALDKQYLTKMSELTDIVKKDNTKNYAYTLENKGIIASSKGNYSYNLQMPSYADGRICCSGNDCEKLNKNYPKCEGFNYDPSPDSCAGDISEPEVKSCSGNATQSCGCLGNGVRSRTCNTTTGQWSAWGTCSISDECDCTAISGDKPKDKTRTCNTCGKQTASYTCNTSTGEWELGSYGTCSKTPAQCNTGGGGGSSSNDDITPISSQLVVFSDHAGEVYLPKDSGMCGYDCGAKSITGTRITARCDSFEAARRVCSSGYVGCISGTIPTVKQTTCTYSTGGTMNCSLGSWCSGSAATGQISWDCPGLSTGRGTIQCEGVKAGDIVDHNCNLCTFGCSPQSYYKCGGSGGSGGPSTGSTCSGIGYGFVSGYVCGSRNSGSLNTSCGTSWGSSSGGSSGCGTGCGGSGECGLGSCSL